MPTWVCLLRALGPSHQLPMHALRSALAAVGMSEVRTYRQTGNVVASSPLQTHEQVTELVRQVLTADFGLGDMRVITRRPDEISQVIAANPFPAEATQRPNLIRVIFLSGVPDQARVARLMSVQVLKDTCRVMGNHVYVDYVHGYHNTHRTAPYFTRVLGVDGTERNWRTVLAISDLCTANPPHRRWDKE
jgi:uncharacterized protein (DUF1697 family)